jgi:hypothetical protein
VAQADVRGDAEGHAQLARSLDIPRAASNFRFFATAILNTEIEEQVTDGVGFKAFDVSTVHEK